MKMLILLLALILSSGSITAQNLTIDGFFAKHRQGKATTSMHVPGWLIRMGLNISANGDVEMEAELAPFRPLLKGLHGIRFLAAEDAKNIAEGTITRFVKKLRKRDYQPLIKVRSEGTSVNVLMRTVARKNKTIVRTLVVAIQDDQDVVVCVINGRWQEGEVQKLLKNQDISELFAGN